MNQTRRIALAIIVLLVLIAIMLGIEALRGQKMSIEDVPPGNIPLYLDGDLEGHFGPADLENWEVVSFVDAEEGKTQEGWFLSDVLLEHIPQRHLKADTLITVSSSSRGKSVELTWSEVEDQANYVMFDLSGRNTLKLVSKLEKLDVRDEWVQDVDRIEIETQ